MNKLEENIIEKMMQFDMYYTNIRKNAYYNKYHTFGHHYISDNDMNDRYYNSRKNIVRIISENDPYGEEIWYDKNI